MRFSIAMVGWKSKAPSDKNIFQRLPTKIYFNVFRQKYISTPSDKNIFQRLPTKIYFRIVQELPEGACGFSSLRF
jgi:hypothetical protein